MPAELITESTLCPDCSKIDIISSVAEANELLQDWRDDLRIHSQYESWEFWNRPGFLVHRFQDRLSVDGTLSCPACSFFQQFLPSEKRSTTERANKFKLVAYCTSKSYLIDGKEMRSKLTWTAVKHNVFLLVVPDIFYKEFGLGDIGSTSPERGMIYPVLPQTAQRATDQIPGLDSSHEIMSPRLVGASLDFSIVRWWLWFCKENHGDSCKSRASRALHRGKSLHGFRLIDCQAREVGGAKGAGQLSVVDKPWTTPYVALSYVWGPPRFDTDANVTPMVVQDAMEATRMMGLRYLWVDQVCIDQNSMQEKAYMISKMAWIYNGAEVTIIAAAGSDSSYGLPGVGLARAGALSQPSVRLSGGVTLVSTMRDPRAVIRDSTWWTRGWTYQEAMLANRRLIFTDQQVYFECEAMAVQESIKLPLAIYHTETAKGGRVHRHMDSFLRSGAIRGITEHTGQGWGFEQSFQDEPLHRIMELDEHICLFSRRNLTHESDSLLAFQGISEQCTSGPDGLGLFLGLPVWNKRRAGGRPLLQPSFALALSFWAHKEEQMFTFYDSPHTTIRRRMHLPSWTWAGWKGDVTFTRDWDKHFELLAALVASGPSPWFHSPPMTIRDKAGAFSARLLEIDSLEDTPTDCSYILCLANPFILDISDPSLTKTKLPKEEGKWLSWGKRELQILLSAPISDHDVLQGLEGGDMVGVLTYLAWIPDGDLKEGRITIDSTPRTGWKSIALFLLLRRLAAEPGSLDGRPAWERVGSIFLKLAPVQKHYEDVLQGHLGTRDILSRLPVRGYGEDIVIE